MNRLRLPITAVLSVTNVRLGLFLASIALLLPTVACGGGGWDPNNVVVTLSPASATVASGAQISLQATVTGLPSDGGNPALTWAIVELQSAGSTGAQCNWRGSSTPQAPSCPDGTIELPMPTDLAKGPNTTTAIYHASGSTGTFHVIVNWSTGFTPAITKSATSTITVTS
jgi:hypothetical protein